MKFPKIYVYNIHKVTKLYGFVVLTQSYKEFFFQKTGQKFTITLIENQKRQKIHILIIFIC